MAEGKENQEQPQIHPGKEKSPQADQAKAAEENKTVLEKFDEKAEENVRKIDEVFENRISASKMAEVALVEVRDMKEAQKKAVKSTFETYKKQYQETQSQNQSDREALAEKLLKSAETIADGRIKNVEMVINMLVKGDYMTEAEAASLKHILVGVEKISAKDVEAQKILVKLQEHKDELDDNDYQRIIAMVNPLDLTAKNAKPQENFDATTAGILIGFMSPVQRYKLVEKFMDSSKNAQTGDLIDGFLKSGILTVAQGEELFAAAVKKGTISQEKFSEVYEKQLRNGFYLEEAKKVQEGIQKEVRRLSGQYANNDFERFASTPVIGTAMMAHSFFWILTNVLASGGDFSALFRNPYLYAALGEGVLAVEMTTGGMKRGTGDLGIGGGWISRAVEKISEKEGAMSTVKQNAYKVMGDIYLSYPDFGSYLENGGAARILSISKARVAGGATSGKELTISFDELMKAETDDAQKARLQAAQDRFPQQTLSQINGISTILTVLEMNSQEEFNNKLAYIKDAQGLQGGVSSAPASAPAAVPKAQKIAGLPEIILPNGQ